MEQHRHGNHPAPYAYHGLPRHPERTDMPPRPRKVAKPAIAAIVLVLLAPVLVFLAYATAGYGALAVGEFGDDSGYELAVQMLLAGAALCVVGAIVCVVVIVVRMLHRKSQ
jgi:hypothetical protein